MAFILCGPYKEHSEKEVSRKNNEGKGCGARVVKNPLMVLFHKSSFRIQPRPQGFSLKKWEGKALGTGLLPDPSSIPGSGKRYEWFILTALVNIRRSITLWKCEVTAIGSSVRRLTFQKSTSSTGPLGRFAA